MSRSWIAGGLLLLTSAGCAMNNTEAGALGGGVIGAGLGTIVGGLSGHPLAGAAIGGAGGALVGGAVGNTEDRREKREAQAVASWQAQNQMTLTDVVSMAQQHISDTIIINQMDTTYTNFNVRPEEITYLKQQGVSDRVITAMQVRRAPPPGYYYRRPGVVYVDPGPPPPVAVGVGFGYGYGPRRCW
jgi:hypothetical protein